MWAAVRGGLRTGNPAGALRLTLVCVCLTGALQAWQSSGPDGMRWVTRLGGVTADQPWWLALLRTPLSLFVAAPNLPVWGALVQLLVVFGVAELTVGRRWTLGIALAATLAASWYARLGVALGPDVPVLGLPAAEGAVRDTGPSAAVAAVAVFVAYRYRAWVLCGLVSAGMLVEAVAKPNLAGKEHVVAVGVALVVAASLRR
nr:hypothetical protein [Streptomyces boncukensis]